MSCLIQVNQNLVVSAFAENTCGMTCVDAGEVTLRGSSSGEIDRCGFATLVFENSMTKVYGIHCQSQIAQNVFL